MDEALIQVSFKEVAHSQSLQQVAVLNIAFVNFIILCIKIRGTELLGDMVSLALLF